MKENLKLSDSYSPQYNPYPHSAQTYVNNGVEFQRSMRLLTDGKLSRYWNHLCLFQAHFQFQQLHFLW